MCWFLLAQLQAIRSAIEAKLKLITEKPLSQAEKALAEYHFGYSPCRFSALPLSSAHATSLLAGAFVIPWCTTKNRRQGAWSSAAVMRFILRRVASPGRPHTSRFRRRLCGDFR